MSSRNREQPRTTDARSRGTGSMDSPVRARYQSLSAKPPAPWGSAGSSPLVGSRDVTRTLSFDPCVIDAQTESLMSPEVSQSALDNERRRSLALQRKSMSITRKEHMKRNLFRKRLQDIHSLTSAFAGEDLQDHSESVITELTEQYGMRNEGVGLTSDSFRQSFIVREMEEENQVLMHPDSFVSTMWDAVMFISIVFTIITDPASLAFAAVNETYWFEVMDRIIMVIFFIDIAMSFCTGYHVDRNNTVEMHWKEVARHYLCGWFIIDFIAALPKEVFSAPQLSSLKGLRIAIIGQHAVKFGKLTQLTKRLSCAVDLSVSPLTFRILSWVGLIATWVHYVACIKAWIWVTVDNTEYMMVDYDGDSFVFDEELCGLHPRKGDCLTRYYLRSLRTALAFWVGHGQFTGNTWREEIAIVICSFSGKILFSSFMSYCVHLTMKITRHRTNHFSQTQSLDRFLVVKNVPQAIRNRARKFLEVSWDHYGAHNEDSCMSLLPERLNSAVHLSRLQPIIRSVPFLSNISDACVKRLAAVVKGEAFVAGDHLMKCGEVSTEMFFIEQGLVQIATEDGELLAVLEEGAYAGENALFGPVVRSTNIYGLTSGTLLMLTSSEFKKVMQLFPEVYENFNARTASEGTTVSEQGSMAPSEFSNFTRDRAFSSISWAPQSEKSQEPGIYDHEIAKLDRQVILRGAARTLHKTAADSNSGATSEVDMLQVAQASNKFEAVQVAMQQKGNALSASIQRSTQNRTSYATWGSLFNQRAADRDRIPGLQDPRERPKNLKHERTLTF